MFGCSPIRRHQKLVEKYPFVHTQDTVTVRDTIRLTVPEVRLDTVVHFDQLWDTVYLEKERLKIRMYRVLDSIYVQGECDTIKIEKVIERKIPIRYYKTESSWLKYAILASILLFTLYAIFRKRNENTNS